ncbi:MAG: hypothetical protein ACRC7O_06100 [Fimbriiglobus sp.]
MTDRYLSADMLELAADLWPGAYLYDKQRQIVRSVEDDDETVVVAGNMLGKDFTAGLVTVLFFLTRNPCRVVTTSAKDDHLRVLWGEIGRWVRTSRVPLLFKDGGCLVLNHQEIRKVVNGAVCPLSYVKGMVASPSTEAAMQGHHVANTGDGVPRTMFVCDESSSVEHGYKKMIDTWARRKLIFGNPWPCDNFFRHAVDGKRGTNDKGGNIPRGEANGGGYYRRVIRIRAEDSPNVKLGLAEVRLYGKASNAVIVPGVKDYAEYVKNRLLWDKVQQTVSLDARFYEGDDVLMFPAAWLDAAVSKGRELARSPQDQAGKRKAKGVGVDPAEGGDRTAMAACDDLGVIEVVSEKTPDTSVIPRKVLAFMQRHDCPADRVCIDRGGGGKQHADALRSIGYAVRTVGFGEAVTLDPKRGPHRFAAKFEQREDRYVYVNRRAELYGELRLALDPAGEYGGWSLPPGCVNLLAELAPVPLAYDAEGRLRLLPKSKSASSNPHEKTLTELIGHSPDEADAVALALHAMRTKSDRSVAGAV